MYILNLLFHIWLVAWLPMLLILPVLAFFGLRSALASKDPKISHNAAIGDRIQNQYYH